MACAAPDDAAGEGGDLGHFAAFPSRKCYLYRSRRPHRPARAMPHQHGPPLARGPGRRPRVDDAGVARGVAPRDVGPPSDVHPALAHLGRLGLQGHDRPMHGRHHLEVLRGRRRALHPRRHRRARFRRICWQRPPLHETARHEQRQQIAHDDLAMGSDGGQLVQRRPGQLKHSPSRQVACRDCPLGLVALPGHRDRDLRSRDPRALAGGSEEGGGQTTPRDADIRPLQGGFGGEAVHCGGGQPFRR
mmetsp:Transcript_65055/g.187189  ORF Transcript_65055/g.187189 Transcript_65055/m.187189 type:complete len:246 (+) Transcript_65055:1667-2404(+)